MAGSRTRLPGRSGRRRVPRGGRRRTDQPGAFPTLLIVDDDDAARPVLQQFLEDSHFRVEAVPDSRSALERLATLRPHLIVASVGSSPDDPDWTALLAKRRRDPQTPVVVLTGDRGAPDETAPTDCAAIIARSAPPDLILQRIRDVFRQNPGALGRSE